MLLIIYVLIILGHIWQLWVALALWWIMFYWVVITLCWYCHVIFTFLFLKFLSNNGNLRRLSVKLRYMFGMVWKVLINDCIFLYLYLYVIMLYLFLCFIELYLSLHFVGSYLYLFLFALCGVLACCLKTCICSCICMTLTLGFVEVYLHSFGLNNAVIKLHFSVFIFLHVLYSFAFLSLIIKLIRHQDVCLLIVCVFLFIF